MTEEQQHDIDVGRPRDRIDIFLDGAAEPLLSTTPPLSFELDTSLMEDGPHAMRIEAYDDPRGEGHPHDRFQRPQRPRDCRRGHPAARCPRWKDPGHRERLWGNHGGQLGTVSGRDTGAGADVGLGAADRSGRVRHFLRRAAVVADRRVRAYPDIRNVRRLPESGRSGGRRRSARTCCRGRAGKHHAAGFDRAVGDLWRLWTPRVAQHSTPSIAPPATRTLDKASLACSRR